MRTPVVVLGPRGGCFRKEEAPRRHAAGGRDVFPLRARRPFVDAVVDRDEFCVARDCREAVESLNWYAGCSLASPFREGFSKGVATPMQEDVLDRVESAVRRQGPASSADTPAAALSAMLKGRGSMYEGTASGVNLAAYQADRVAFPESLVGAPILAEQLSD